MRQWLSWKAGAAKLCSDSQVRANNGDKIASVDQYERRRKKKCSFTSSAPVEAFTLIGVHPRSPHTFSGHSSLILHIVEYDLQRPFRGGWLCLPAQRATSTWKFSFLLPPQGTPQPMTNWYKEVKPHLPCLDEFRISSDVIHMPESLRSFPLRLTFQRGFFPFLVCFSTFSQVSPGSTSLINPFIINDSLLAHLPKTPTNKSHMGKVPVGHKKGMLEADIIVQKDIQQ